MTLTEQHKLGQSDPRLEMGSTWVTSQPEGLGYSLTKPTADAVDCKKQVKTRQVIDSDSRRKKAQSRMISMHRLKTRTKS